DNKFGTFHYLSIDLTSRLNLALFESIIWQGSDTLVDRGIDVNYLNPIIFFRPVEFSTGSADNSLIGLALKYKLHNNLVLYGQVIIDEFLFSEVRSGRGSWRNKQGFQLGYKYFDVFGIPNLWMRGEFNYVRPFTYSHGSVEQNYAHFNQALAHPLGANFWESLAMFHYQHGNWSWEARFQYALIGSDEPGNNVGADLFRSYDDRLSDFGYYVGDGVRSDLLISGMRVAYLLWPGNNLQLTGEYFFRNLDTEGVGATNTHIFTIGLSTSLSNWYQDF
ncbi:MAG: gliding motility protein RemB, partial [Bacteroidota bacterium]